MFYWEQIYIYEMCLRNSKIRRLFWSVEGAQKVKSKFILLVGISTFWVQCCDVRYDDRIKTMFGSSLPAVVCRRARVLFTLFVFVYSGIQHILCCVFGLFVLVLCTLCCQYLWIVYFDCPLGILSIFTNVYLSPYAVVIKCLNVAYHKAGWCLSDTEENSSNSRLSFVLDSTISAHRTNTSHFKQWQHYMILQHECRLFLWSLYALHTRM
jgi:hypothetical protein